MIAGVGAGTASARQDGVLPINDPIQLFLERQQAAGRIHAPVLSQLPLSEYEAAALLDSVAARREELSEIDAILLARYRGEAEYPGASWARGIWGILYRNGRDYVAASSPDWAIRFNPLVVVAQGRGVRTALPSVDRRPRVTQFTYGLRTSGHLTHRLFFEGRFTVNRQRVVKPDTTGGSAPRQGFTNLRPGGEYDYLESTGIVGYRTRFVELRAGRDRARWGPALSSVSLSGYAAPYDQFVLRVHFWRLSYTSLLAGFSSTKTPGTPAGNGILRRKYGSLHRVDLALHRRFQVGLSEAVIFATDSLGARRGFDWSYAQPLIFLRAAERDRGSPDNALISGSWSWVPVSGLRAYGELLLDESPEAPEARPGYWAAKYAWVAGLHVVDWPFRGLSARFETTRVRPYTYSHADELNAYVHHGDPLGFSGGANAVENAAFVEWQPSTRVYASLAAVYTRQGRNGQGVNYGSDPTVSYNSRAGDYDQSILQGVRRSRLLVEGQIGYEVLPSLVLEAAARCEVEDDAEMGVDRYVTPFVQLRWGLPFGWSKF